MKPVALKKMKRLKEEALGQVAKSEHMQFRVDAETIKRLYALAAERRQPVGAMVRQWVLERIAIETTEDTNSESDLIGQVHAYLVREADTNREILARVDELRQSLEKVKPGLIRAREEKSSRSRPHS